MIYLNTWLMIYMTVENKLFGDISFMTLLKQLSFQFLTVVHKEKIYT